MMLILLSLVIAGFFVLAFMSQENDRLAILYKTEVETSWEWRRRWIETNKQVRVERGKLALLRDRAEVILEHPNISKRKLRNLVRRDIQRRVESIAPFLVNVRADVAEKLESASAYLTYSNGKPDKRCLERGRFFLNLAKENRPYCPSLQDSITNVRPHR